MAILNGTNIRVYDSSTNILVAYAQNGSINLNFGIVPSNGKEFSLLESFNRNVANNKAAIIK